MVDMQQSTTCNMQQSKHRMVTDGTVWYRMGGWGGKFHLYQEKPAFYRAAPPGASPSEQMISLREFH